MPGGKTTNMPLQKLTLQRWPAGRPGGTGVPDYIGNRPAGNDEQHLALDVETREVATAGEEADAPDVALAGDAGD